jgi:hypothetical protein
MFNAFHRAKSTQPDRPLVIKDQISIDSRPSKRSVFKEAARRKSVLRTKAWYETNQDQKDFFESKYYFFCYFKNETY